MAKVTKQRNGKYLLESAGVQEVFKFDTDVGNYVMRNAHKIQYHSGEKNRNWQYNCTTGRKTTLARRIYDSFKGCNKQGRNAPCHVRFHNGDKRDMRRANLTTTNGLKRST